MVIWWGTKFYRKANNLKILLAHEEQIGTERILNFFEGRIAAGEGDNNFLAQYRFYCVNKGQQPRCQKFLKTGNPVHV